MANINVFQAFTQAVSNKTRINYETALLIVSYFKEYLPKINLHPHCYINVMNNHTMTDNDKFKNIYIRKEHGYAHLTVVYFDTPEDSGFRNFENRKYYYIIKATEDGKFSIRDELIHKWASSSNAPDLLILDVSNRKVMIKNPKDLTRFAINRRLNEDSNFVFDFDITETGWSDWAFVSDTENIEEVKAFLAQFNNYLGNIKYNEYEARTSVKVIGYKNGIRTNTVIFKSIKQAYDSIYNYDLKMSYKTFQRRCNAAKPSLIETPNMKFYVTTKLDFTGPDSL